MLGAFIQYLLAKLGNFSLQSAEEWQVVFWITFAILVAGTVIFWVLMSGERQEWDKTESKPAAETMESQTDTAGS